MDKRKRTVGLIAFLKGSSKPADRMPGCANYNKHYGGCLFCHLDCDPEDCLYCVDFEAIRKNSYCRIERRQRCGYFEKCVLPTAEDIGLKNMVYSLYRKHVGIEDKYELDTGEIRRCPDCGVMELRKRQRYCDDCSRERRLQAYRKSRQNLRSKRNS